MQAVAIGWQIYDLTGSALDLGLSASAHEALRQNERAGVATGPEHLRRRLGTPQATPRGVSSSSRTWRFSGCTVSRSGTMTSSPGW